MIPQTLANYYSYHHRAICSICRERSFSMIAHIKPSPTEIGPRLRCPVHEECLKAWLSLVKQNPHCPTCRAPVDPNQLPSLLRERKIKKIKENIKFIATIVSAGLALGCGAATITFLALRAIGNA